MKIVIFMMVFLVGIIIIPDSMVGNVINHVMSFPGDGEEGMDNFYFTILLIKIILSAMIAMFALWIYRRYK